MADHQQLWGDIKRGDRKAFDQLYRTYAKTLYNYGYKFTKDVNLIETSIHEIFMNIWKNRSELTDSTVTKSYLLTSFRNQISIDVQKGKEKKSGEKEAINGIFELELSGETAIVQEESIIENKASLNQSFSQLNPTEKEAIYLKYQNHLASAEICKMMDISNQSFRNTLSSAVNKVTGKILNN